MSLPPEAASLLAAFATSPAATRTQISHLSSSRISSLLDALSSSTPTLLRAVWTHPPLHARILIALTAPHTKAALLDELELLLLSDARATANDARRRLKHVSLLATGLVRHARSDVSGARAPHVAPLLIYLSRAAGAVATRAAARVSGSIMHVALHLVSSAASTRAVNLLLEERELPAPAVRVLARYVDACEQPDLAPVFLRLLRACPTSPPLLDVCMVCVRRARADALAAIFAVVEAVVPERDAASAALARGLSRVALAPGHVALMYCLLGASSGTPRDVVARLLENVARGDASVDTSAAGSSAADAASAGKSVLLESVKFPCVAERYQTVLDFFEALLWRSRRDLREAADALLFEVFVWVSAARDGIIRVVVAALVEERVSVDVLEAFCGLFERMSTTARSMFALRECQGALGDALDAVSRMPAGIDCRVVAAVVPVVMAMPSLCDKLLMFLRKVAAARSRRLQRIACSGLLAVVEQDDAPPELFREACETLGVLVEMSETPVRSHLLVLLLDMVERDPELRSRIWPLSKVIMGRLKVAELSGTKTVSQREECARIAQDATVLLDFSKYFSFVGGEYIASDPLSLLLRFCAKLRQDNANVSKFFAKLITYLGDMNGALSDVCTVSKSPVPVLERVKLLCEVLETLLGLEIEGIGESHVLAYGLALVAKDIYAVRPSSAEANRHAYPKTDMAVTENQFASLTAREVAASDHDSRFLEKKFGEQMNSLTLRVQALSIVGKLEDSQLKSLVSVTRAEILSHLDADVSAVLALKSRNFDQAKADHLLGLVRTSYAQSSPWYSSPHEQPQGENSVHEGVRVKRSTRASVETTSDPENDASKEMPSAGADLTQSFISALNFDKEVEQALETNALTKLQEDRRIRIRQASLRVIQALLSHNMVRDDVALLLDMAERELESEGAYHVQRDARKSQKVGVQPTVLPAQSSTDKRVLAVSGVTRLFRREFANSLSIGLTLSYLALLRRMVEKRNAGSDTVPAELKKIVSTTIMDLLREYAIRHLSVMRDMLRLLLKALSETDAMGFTKSVLGWLGNDPCLLNSKFVESEEDVGSRTGVGDFDRDILEEAIALDTGQVSDEEETSASMEKEISSRETIGRTPERTSCEVEDSQNCMQSTLRKSTSHDPVRSLCLDETPEIGLLAVGTVLDFCDEALLADLRRHREVKSGAIGNLQKSATAENVSKVLTHFFDTAFVGSITPKRPAVPLQLLRKLAGLLLALMEILEEKLRLLHRLFREKGEPEPFWSILRAVKAICNLLYESNPCHVVLSVVPDSDRSLKRGALQERITVAAAGLFRLARGAEPELRDKVKDDMKDLAKLLNSRGTHFLQTHATKTRLTGPGIDTLMQPEDSFLVSRPQKRQRLRSRNREVDEWLQDERGGDNFADLEDFVVSMDADDL